MGRGGLARGWSAQLHCLPILSSHWSRQLSCVSQWQLSWRCSMVVINRSWLQPHPIYTQRGDAVGLNWRPPCSPKYRPHSVSFLFCPSGEESHSQGGSAAYYPFHPRPKGFQLSAISQTSSPPLAMWSEETRKSSSLQISAEGRNSTDTNSILGLIMSDISWWH